VEELPSLFTFGDVQNPSPVYPRQSLVHSLALISEVIWPKQKLDLSLFSLKVLSGELFVPPFPQREVMGHWYSIKVVS